MKKLKIVFALFLFVLAVTFSPKKSEAFQGPHTYHYADKADPSHCPWWGDECHDFHAP